MTGGVGRKEKEVLQEKTVRVGGKDIPLVLDFAKIPYEELSSEVAKLFRVGPSEFEFYNPSNIFINPPGLYQAVRVDLGNVAKSIIFQHLKDTIQITNVAFELEDPQVINVIPGKNGQRIAMLLSGVDVDRFINESGEQENVCRKQDFFFGPDIYHLEHFFSGPSGMKDIRLNRIGPSIRILPGFPQDVYTRPRYPGNESLGGDGQIGHRRFDSILSLQGLPPSSLDIEHAPLINYRFPEGKWGGVNDSELIRKGPYAGWNKILIHEASKTGEGEEQERSYCIAWLFHNPTTGEVIDPGIRIKRPMLPDGPWKNQHLSRDLWNVVYGTAFRTFENRDCPLDDFQNNFTRIYLGVGDARTYVIESPNPEIFLN